MTATIMTNYSPGDFVWTMFKNKPVRFKIEYIVITTHKNYTNIHYYLSENGSYVTMDKVTENNLFDTKQDLLESL